MRRWWVLLGGVLVTAGLGWWVVQVTLMEVTDRSNASGYGQFVLAAIGLVIIVGGWIIRVLKPAGAPDLDALTDVLARAMRIQWENAANDRRLLQPAPLPIRWRRSAEPVAGPLAAVTAIRDGHAPFDPLPGLKRVTRSDLSSGNRRALHRVYGGVASGRLLIIGGPGTGKSSAAVLLLLDALRYRDQATPVDRHRIPVPVLFTLANWNPNTTSVQDWLITKLNELPSLQGRHGTDHAVSLLRAGRIAVFLDGLDEIPEQVRSVALQALSEQATFRLVVLTRTAELADAAQRHPLIGAVALEIQPLAPADVADYFLRPLTEPAPSAWLALTTVLTVQPDSTIARALITPLTVGLLRDIHPPSAPVDELLDISRFPHPDDITNHLLDHAITAAYAQRPGEPSPRYTAETAHRTLAFIARRLNQHNTRDLAWWTIPNWIPHTPRILIYLAFYLACGLAGGLAGGLPGGLAGGLAFGLAGGLVQWGLAAGLGPVLLGWPGLGAEVAGEITGATDSVSPVKVWRDDVAFGLAVGLPGGLAFGLAFGLAGGLAGGLAFGLAGGPLVLLNVSRAGNVVVFQIYFAARHQTPFRLMRFLEDARSRHLLRTVGPNYQFRHATLQDRLAR